MRIAASVVLVASLVSPALAERGAGASFDFGYVRNTVGVSDNASLPANSARFGIRVATGSMFHFGAEVEKGYISGDAVTHNGYVARQVGTGTPPMLDEVTGETLELKSYAGLHTMAGPLMLGGDAVIGIRDTSTETFAGPNIADKNKELVLALRARADVFVTDYATVGAMASSDMIDRRNVSVALVVSLNFMR